MNNENIATHKSSVSRFWYKTKFLHYATYEWFYRACLTYPSRKCGCFCCHYILTIIHTILSIFTLNKNGMSLALYGEILILSVWANDWWDARKRRGNPASKASYSNINSISSYMYYFCIYTYDYGISKYCNKTDWIYETTDSRSNLRYFKLCHFFFWLSSRVDATIEMYIYLPHDGWCTSILEIHLIFSATLDKQSAQIKYQNIAYSVILSS